MVGGAVTVFAWKYLLAANFGDSVPLFNLYEILPGALVNLVLCLAVSKLTYAPDAEIEAEFDAAVEAAR